MAATVGLAFAAADGSPDARTTAAMALAMFFAQSCIGVTNDVFDRRLDAETKPWKPLVSGLVAPSSAAILAGACLAAALVLGATIGPASMGLLALGTACGLAYDVRLKRTLLSAVPFMIAIPTLPAWVYVSFDRWQSGLWWLLPLGALIGLSVHLANTLPDIDSDTAHGVDGFAHRLGVRRSMYLSWIAFAAALALSLALWPLLDYDARWYAVVLAVGGGCLVGTIRAYVARGEPALRLNFAAMSIAAAATAAGWLAAVT
jgi:4-hydroxybenzoate polyprenyltransferase